MTSIAAEEAGIVARETGALRPELSMTIQDTLPNRTRLCLEKKAVARPSRVDSTTSPATSPKPPPGAAKATTASGSGEGNEGKKTRGGASDGDNPGGVDEGSDTQGGVGVGVDVDDVVPDLGKSQCFL